MTLLARLRDLWSSPNRAPGSEHGRWVVIDTETTGLDLTRDRLLSIGAVAVDDIGIVANDSFEVVLRSEGIGDAENIAIHGVGHAAQRAGMLATDALAACILFIGSAPCIAYHADFDRVMLERAARANNVELPSWHWLDLDPLAAALYPERNRGSASSLDDWLELFGIDITTRHNAAGDAYATAELLLRLRAIAADQGVTGFGSLMQLAPARRWLGAD